MSIRFFFAGDVVIMREWRDRFLGESLRAKIRACDVVCCNFEAPITGEPQVKAVKIGPSLSQNERTVQMLKEEGFSLFSFANNHIMDYGMDGLKRTLDACCKEDVCCIGAGTSAEEAYKPFVFEKEGIRVGIVSVAENGFGTSIREDTGGYAWFGAKRIYDTLEELLGSCDHVFVICHGGAEKWNIPLPEYRELYRSWIDKGVHAVIAHHPHVPQGFEQYHGGGIYYSLGNFAFDKGQGIQDPRTVCAQITIEGQTLHFDSVLTEFTEHGVEECSDETFIKHMEDCNALLLEPLYSQTVNQMVQKAFREKYRNYFGNVMNLYSGGVKQWGKTIVYRGLKGERFSNEWLYHNLAIETHYWICRRAMDLVINPIHEEDNQ